MSTGYRIEPLAGQDRAGFSCGDAALDRYFRDTIGQDVRRRAATAFVVVDPESGAIVGFYTLSASDVDRRELPAALAAKAPRYARIPAILLGRLGVDVSYQGRGLGKALLADALGRVLRSEVGAHMMLVEPKNDRAASFYCSWGFYAATAPSRLMFLPIDTAKELLTR